MKTHIEVYRDKAREWRWRAKRNGRIVAEGGEGYKRLAGCKRAVAKVIVSLPESDLVVLR